jgi:hypothetical protein
MDTRDEILNTSKDLLLNGATVEQVLRYCRDQGLSIIESMQLLKRLLNIPLDEAKRIAHWSETWSDLRSSHDNFHDAAEKAAQSFSKKTT